MSFWTFPSCSVTPAQEYTDSVSDIKMDGAASVGVIDKTVRADHVHPSDTTKAPLDSPALITPDIGVASGNSLTGKAGSLVLQGSADAGAPAFAYLRGNAGANQGIRAGKYGQDYTGQRAEQFATISTSTTIETYDLNSYIAAIGGAGGITITLPAPELSYWGGANTGRFLFIKKVDNGAGFVTIAGTIDGTTNRVLYFEGDAICLLSFGYGGWRTISQCFAPAYGLLYTHDGVTAQSIPTGATYTKLTGFTTVGLSSGTTPSATNDNIVITKPGRYSVWCTISTTVGTANTTWDFAVFVNGVEQDQAHTGRFFSSTSDVGSLAMSGLVNVSTSGHAIDIRARHLSGGSVNITPQDMTLYVKWEGPV